MKSIPFISLRVLSVFSSLLFFSCSDNLVVSPPALSDNYEWTLQSSSVPLIVDRICAVDSETAYLYGRGVFKKLKNGVFSDLDLGSNFNCDIVESYNSNYTVFCGNENNTGKFKILSDNTVTTVILPDSISYLEGLKILEPGKFLLGAFNKYYVFNNGKFTSHFMPTGESYENIGKSDNQYYLVTQSPTELSMYRFQEDSLVFIQKMSIETEIYSLNNKIIKYTYETDIFRLSSFNGSTWDLFFSGAYSHPFEIVGENVSSIYSTFFGGGTFLTYAWTGTNLLRDKNFPPGDLLRLSNMKENTLFAVIYPTVGSVKIYKGKKIR